jgi:hypothetical protein
MMDGKGKRQGDEGIERKPGRGEQKQQNEPSLSRKNRREK